MTNIVYIIRRLILFIELYDCRVVELIIDYGIHASILIPKAGNTGFLRVFSYIFY